MSLFTFKNKAITFSQEEWEHFEVDFFIVSCTKRLESQSPASAVHP